MIPKFRAWDKEHDEMLYPDDVDKIYFEITVDGIVTYDMRYVLPYDDIPPYLDTVIMQSTGLHDENKEEVFEDDIVWHDQNEDYGVVEIDEAKFVIRWQDGYSEDLFERIDLLEVVGNIYSHSHLLDNGGYRE